MPDLVEHMYCSQQINIPPTFPYILKQYAKAAIRTQPFDLLHWTVAYFRAMAEGEVPPVKLRFEHVPLDSPTGLTPGYLRVLLRQLGHKGTIPVSLLFEKWNGVCLSEESLLTILKIGDFVDEVDWLHFVGIAAGHLTRSLGETMIMLCQLLTREPEGGSAMIPCSTFNDLYTYLAKLDCGPDTPEEADEELPTAEEDAAEDGDKEPAENMTIKTPSSTTAASSVSVDSVGEEPPLPPLVYFRPSLPQTEQEGEGESQPGVEAVVDDSCVIGKDPFTYHLEDEVIERADEETQTEIIASADSLVQGPQFDVPGIGPVLSDEQIEAVVKYMEWWSERQQGMSMPRNIRHFLCPPLDHLPLPDPCTDQYSYPNTNIYP